MTLKRLIIAALVLSLMACVTTQGKMFSAKVSKEKELQSRLQVAVSYLQDNQPEAAMRHLKIAMELDPKSAKVHEILALTLEKMGDDDKVYKHFKKMLWYDGSYTRGRANYGSYLMRKEDYNGAYKQFMIVTDDIYYQNRAVAYQQLAICAEKIGKNEEIILYYQKALGIDSSFLPAMFALAEFHYNNGNYPLSQQYLDQYRSKTKNSPPRLLLLGVKLARVFQDKNEEASYALALKNLYPKSQEYLDYVNMKGN